MIEKEKDFPLLLIKKKDRKLYLDNRYDRGFPPKHEFSMQFMLESGCTELNSSLDTITLRLGNATATYSIDRDLMDETRSTGYWGNLESEEISG